MDSQGDYRALFESQHFNQSPGNFSAGHVITKLQPLHNTVLDITRLKDGSQKCRDYIDKMTINGHFSL